MQVDASELTREEQLELQLAEARAQNATLAAALAQRQVQDTSAALDQVRARLIQAVTERRAAAVASQRDAQRVTAALLERPEAEEAAPPS